MLYMFARLRRIRNLDILRNKLLEHHVNKSDLIYPLFIHHGKNVKNAVEAMPGIFQYSLDRIDEEIQQILVLGIDSVLLFGIPSYSDDIGSDALDEEGLIAQAIRYIKQKYPQILVISDLCFCEYTKHGHCGIIDDNGLVDNDKTLSLSLQQALIHARAGVDMIAPSGMMDGIIQTLRTGLDEASFINLPIMAYSTKFASAYYGPFRQAAAIELAGTRANYQMPIQNAREALAESLADEAQGADILMVKPALAYLDIVRNIHENSLLPLAVYNTSAEYAMVQFAGIAKAIDADKIIMENMIAFKRAGAKLIISYHAKQVAQILNQ